MQVSCARFLTVCHHHNACCCVGTEGQLSADVVESVTVDHSFIDTDLLLPAQTLVRTHTHLLYLARLDLPLPDSSLSTIISPPECHHHHSYHPSPRHSSIPNSKLSYFSNPTLHRHLAHLRTDFTDTRTALRLFSVSVFF